MTIVIGAAADIFLIWIIKRQVDKTASKRDDILGNHKFELYNKGIKEISEVKNQMHTWKSIKDIKQDENNIYIFLGGLEANIIPKRAFETIDESKDFYDKCIKYYNGIKK
nr:YcxB family protein [Clostridium botulinum]